MWRDNDQWVIRVCNKGRSLLPRTGNEGMGRLTQELDKVVRRGNEQELRDMGCTAQKESWGIKVDLGVGGD